MIRVIDIETTGTAPTTDAIIEIASVDLSKERDYIGICNPMQTFVSIGERSIPPAASAVHHILDEDLTSAPPLLEAIERFKGADVYVAHNAEFEQSFLKEHIGDAPWVCTFKCALRLWPGAEGHSNQALRYELGLARPFSTSRKDIHPHRASSDVVVTAAILVEAMQIAPWSQLLAWSKEPALHTRFGFGKHRGNRYDAHLDYCEWILTQRDMDPGVRFSAEYWLKKQREAA